MPDVLLATKLHIPALRRNLVSRPHLVQRLNDGLAQNHRLVLVSAPAGYGKSTLLSEWVSQVGLPVAWLSLEKTENVPSRFWTYFVTALSSNPLLHQAGCCEAFLQAVRAPNPPPVQVLLTNLVNDLSNLPGKVIMVLDDLHAVSDGQIHSDLVFLVDHLPSSASGLHLVVASRMDPPWPLARWRARGQLTELRSSDLRFSYPEVAQFLNQTLPYELSAQDITVLHARTEGWIVGLQMAALSLQARFKAQGSSGVSGFIETFSGSHRFILDYLMEEVISQQPLEIRSFLQATSLLEGLTASLCDALLLRQDSQAILDQLEQANLFLIPLDEQRRWYRYHHLFAELLRKNLQQTQPEMVTQLHQRASEWYAEHNFLPEAISHALDAGDVGRVNRYISGNALAMVEHTELQRVLHSFEQVSEPEICSRPWLCIAYAWVKAYVDPTQGIGRTLEKALQSLSEVADSLERQHLASHLDAIWAYVAWIQGEADLALEYARTALQYLPEDDWMTRTHVLNTAGLALQYQGDLPAAICSWEAAVAAGQQTGKHYHTFFAYANLAFVNILQGHLHHAYALCQHVLSLAEQDGLPHPGLPVLAYAYSTLSLVLLEWNQLESALYNARRAVAWAEQWHQADTLHYALTCLVDVLSASEDFSEAFAVNQRSMLLAAHVSPWFVRLSAIDEIFLNLEKGDVANATHRFTELEPLLEKMDRVGRFTLLKASLFYAQANYVDTLNVIDDVLAELLRRDQLWILMNLLPLRALALQALGRQAEAMNSIGDCLTRAKPEGFARIFLKHGTPMYRLLQAAAQQGVEVEYISQLLPAFNIPSSPAASAMPPSPEEWPKSSGATPVEPLSERELQVLRLLDSPLTSAEIGRELYVSANTIRTHLRNIYAKLGVNRRGDAVQVAKKIKLL